MKNNISELINFIKENKRYPSKESTDLSENQLYELMIKVRNRYAAKKLSQEEIVFLTSNDFSWTLHEQNWQEKFFQLKIYLNQFGKYPTRYDENKDISILGSWVSNQRASYKKGELDQKKISKLDSIGFVWEERSEEIFDQKWQEKLNNFIQFVQEKGRYPSQYAKIYNEKTLGNWVFTQRINFKSGKLSEDKIKILNGLGFIWEERAHSWLEQFEAFLKFRETYKKYPNKSSSNALEKDLGVWVCIQRTKFRQGKLLQDRKLKLDSIGFIWQPIVIDEKTGEFINITKEHVNNKQSKELKLVQNSEEYIEKEGENL